MNRTLDLTEEEREQFEQRIENFFELVRDVLNDPTILKEIPDGAHVEPIPKPQREPGRHYDVETDRMVVTVTPANDPTRSR